MRMHAYMGNDWRFKRLGVKANAREARGEEAERRERGRAVESQAGNARAPFGVSFWRREETDIMGIRSFLLSYGLFLLLFRAAPWFYCQSKVLFLLMRQPFIHLIGMGARREPGAHGAKEDGWVKG